MKCLHVSSTKYVLEAIETIFVFRRRCSLAILCILGSVHELGDAVLGDELDQGAALGPVLSLGPPLHQISDELQFRPRCLV